MTHTIVASVTAVLVFFLMRWRYQHFYVVEFSYGANYLMKVYNELEGRS